MPLNVATRCFSLSNMKQYRCRLVNYRLFNATVDGYRLGVQHEVSFLKYFLSVLQQIYTSLPKLVGDNLPHFNSFSFNQMGYRKVSKERNIFRLRTQQLSLLRINTFESPVTQNFDFRDVSRFKALLQQTNAHPLTVLCDNHFLECRNSIRLR